MQFSHLFVANLLAASTWAEVQHFTNKTLTDGFPPGTWMVKFYSSTCGYSKRMAQNYTAFEEKISETNTSLIKIGEVECHESFNICTEYNITGYPTLKIFENGKFIEEFAKTGLVDLTDYANEKYPMTA